MAKRKKAVPRLSRRGATRDRLDAIGRWRAEPGERALTVAWERPAVLATRGLAARLEFRVETDGEHFDPDDRMFELWDAIQARRAAFLRDLKARMAAPVLVDGDDDEEGVERSDLDPYDPTLVIYRSDFGGEPRYGVEVVAEAGDEEHVLTLRYDSVTGRLARGWELM